MGGLARLVSGLFLAGLSQLSSGCEKSSWTGYERERQLLVWPPQEEQEEDLPILRSSLIDYGEPHQPIIDDVELAGVLRRFILLGYMNKRDEVAEQRLKEMFAILGIDKGIEALLEGNVPPELRERFRKKGFTFRSSRNNGFELARIALGETTFDFEGEQVVFFLDIVRDVKIPTKKYLEGVSIEKWLENKNKRGAITVLFSEGNRIFSYSDAVKRYAKESYQKMQELHTDIEAILDGQKKADLDYLLYSRLLRYKAVRKIFQESKGDAAYFVRKAAGMLNAGPVFRRGSNLHDLKHVRKEERNRYWTAHHLLIRGYLRSLKGGFIPHYVCGAAASELSQVIENKDITNENYQQLYKHTFTEFFNLLGRTYHKAQSKYKSIQMDAIIPNETFRIMDALLRATPSDLRELGKDAFDRKYGKDPFNKWLKKNPQPKPRLRYKRVPGQKVPV